MLTDIQKQVLSLNSQRFTHREISDELGISVHTVRTTLKRAESALADSTFFQIYRLRDIERTEEITQAWLPLAMPHKLDDGTLSMPDKDAAKVVLDSINTRAKLAGYASDGNKNPAAPSVTFNINTGNDHTTITVGADGD